MKNILAFITLTLGLLLPCTFAQSNQLVSSTARIIRVDEIMDTSDNALNRTPESCTGALLSAEGHVFTSDKLVHAGDSSSGVEYLVMFPIYKNDNVYAVHAYLGRSQAVSADNHLLVIKINKSELPEPIAISSNEIKNNLDIVNIGYPDAISKGMSFEDRGRINVALKEICTAMRTSGRSTLTLTNEEQDIAQLMQYVTPQEDKGHVIRMTSQQGTRTVIQHRTNIDRGSEGSPLIDSSNNRLAGITTSVIIGENPYNNAQSAGTVHSCATTFNIELNTGSFAAGNKKALIIYGSVGVLVVLIIIVVIALVCKKPSAKAAETGNTVDAPPAVPAAAPAPIAPTVECLFELVSETGERHVVTSDMVRRTVRIGRNPECELTFSHATVSGFHAILSRHNGRAAITDTKSTGGTKVNGERLTPEHPKTLHKGDVITLGSCRVNVR